MQVDITAKSISRAVCWNLEESTAEVNEPMTLTFTYTVTMETILLQDITKHRTYRITLN